MATVPHHVTRDHIVYSLDRTHPPVLDIESGDVVVLETYDARSGTVQRDEDLLEQPHPKGSNPATGPVRVRGAEPGDGLCVEIQQIELADSGFLAVKAGDGLLGHHRRPSGHGTSRAHGRRGNGPVHAGERADELREGLHAHERGRGRADLPVLRARRIPGDDPGRDPQRNSGLILLRQPAAGHPFDRIRQQTPHPTTGTPTSPPRHRFLGHLRIVNGAYPTGHFNVVFVSLFTEKELAFESEFLFPGVAAHPI